MRNVHNSPLNMTQEYTIQTIALLDADGDGEGPESMIPYWLPQMAGFRVVHVPLELRSLTDIVDFIRAHAQAAICVHRLGYPGTCSFSGAELVATLYDIKFPALLVTQYTEIDQSSSLRTWRGKLPVVLNLREFESETITGHLNCCVAEVQGHLLDIPEKRVPYRVLISVQNVERMSEETFIDICVHYWDHYQIVRCPLALIPSDLHTRIVPGVWLFAHVNVRAEFATDLYFRAFEIAPAPEYDEQLTYCVNMLNGSGETQNHNVSEFFQGQDAYEALMDTTYPDTGIYEIGDGYN